MAEVNLGAAQALEDKFQSLHESGAFEHKPLETAPQLPEVDASPPAAAGGEETQPEAAPEAPEYSSLDEFLEKNKYERDSVYSLPVKVKADGKDYEVPLSDLVKSYGLEKHFQQKSIAFAEAQKAWESEREQAKTQWDNQLKTAKNLATMAHEQLLSEYRNINWNELRQRDPQQWLLMDREFNNRANQIQNHLAQIAQAEQERANQAATEQKSVLAKENEKLLSAVPEWRDETTRTTETRAMRDYARSRGFSDDELNGIFDHRYMQVLRDAARLADFQSKANAAVKKVRAAPQVSNAGARVTRDPKAVAYKEANEKWAKNRRDNDAAVAVFSHFT